MSIYLSFIGNAIFGVFFLLSLLADADYVGAEIILPSGMIFYHLWKVIQFKKSTELTFLLFFSISFPIFWIISLVLSVDLHYLFEYVDNRFVAKAFATQGLFIVCLFLGMRDLPPVIISQYTRRNSSIVFWGCILLMTVFLLTAVSSIDGNILKQSYSIESGSSILFEYVLILIILAYSYSGNNNARRLILIAMALLFVITPIFFGKRLPASMVAFSIILLFFRPKSLKQVLGIFLGGFFILSILALFRVGESGQATNIIFNISEDGVMRNNQGGVIYSSAAYIKLTETGIFDLMFGIDSAFNTILSILLPSAMVDESAYINIAAMKYIPIPGNGGLPGVAFYVWGRVLAVIVFGLFIGWLMARSRYNYLASVYVSFLFFTFPRWMSYNINIMFKMGVLLIIAWFIVRLIIYASRHWKPQLIICSSYEG